MTILKESPGGYLVASEKCEKCKEKPPEFGIVRFNDILRWYCRECAKQEVNK